MAKSIYRFHEFGIEDNFIELLFDKGEGYFQKISERYQIQI